MAVPAQALPLKYARERRTQYPSYFRLGYAGLLAGATIAVCILSILYLAQTGRVATRGYMLQELQDEHVKLLREAEQFEFRIAAANELDSIERRALEVGLRPATKAQQRFARIEMPARAVVAQR